jgi:beta-phosphoglucomutase-like phosphatase (HAD superfamily)
LKFRNFSKKQLDSVAGIQAAHHAEAFPVVVLAKHNEDGDFGTARLTVRSLNAPGVIKVLSASSFV